MKTIIDILALAALGLLLLLVFTDVIAKVISLRK